MNIVFHRMHPDAIIPTKGTPGAAGLDLYAIEDVELWPRESKAIRTGLAMAIPTGYVGIIKSRSGLAFRSSIEMGAGVIDADYRGEVLLLLRNHALDGNRPVTIARGDRAGQLVLIPVPALEVLEVDRAGWATLNTTRGHHGFGSTGR